MVDPTSPLDPYKSPEYSLDPALSPGHRPLSGRPGVLTAICVIAIVLGGLGLGTGLLAVVSLVGGEAIQAAIPDNPGMDEEMKKIQTEMEQEMQAVTDRYWGYHAVFLLGHFAVATGLLAGGIMAIKMNPKGRTVLWDSS